MTKSAILFIITAAVLVAQSAGPGGPGGGPGGRGRAGGGPGATSALGGPSGTWWRDPAIVQNISLTADQQKKIEDAYQQSRLHLIDLTAAVEKEQVTMEPLLAAEHPDEAKILVQIDRIAQARAELEKANARMLLGFRNVLTQDQWAKLRAERPAPGQPPAGRGGQGQRQGPPPPP